jgi:hypothetical protein
MERNRYQLEFLVEDIEARGLNRASLASSEILIRNSTYNISIGMYISNI